MADLIAAIKELRSRLGDTQQSFANRLGRSLRAITNYEGGRQPTTEVLIQLAQLAALHKMDDLTRVFGTACNEEMKGRTTPANEEEAVWVRAVLTILRNKEAAPEWSTIATAIAGALQELMVTACSADWVRTDPAELEKTVFAIRRVLAPPTAEQKLESMARERSARTGESFEKSYSAALLEHPELYTEYLQQRADADRGLSFESSLAVYGTRQHAEAQKKPARKTTSRRKK